MKRSPIKRSTKPLKRTPLKRVGNKQRAKLRLYHQLKATFLGLHPYCQANLPPEKVFCAYYSMDVHHVAKRGSKLNDTGLWLAVCRNCHVWITDHAREARTLGLLK